MARVLAKLPSPRVLALLTGVALAVAALLQLTPAYGDLLPHRSIQLADAQPSANTNYILNFTIAAPETLGSIQLQFCANDPLFDQPCTVPTGFDVSHAVLISQTGQTGFTVAGSTTANVLVLTRAASAAIAGPDSYTLSGVVNPSAPGSYYGRLQTFASTDASGAANDYGGIAFVINSAVQISTVVPPFLLFCSGVSISGNDCSTATGNYINYGNFSASSTSSGQTQMLVATNATTGYTIGYTGTTLTSGNNIIPALSTADVSRPGVSQFGINLAANQNPHIGQNPSGPGGGTVTAAYSQQDLYKFLANDTLAGSPNPEDFRLYTVSYIANTSKGQPAGVYASTVTFVALANF